MALVDSAQRGQAMSPPRSLALEAARSMLTDYQRRLTVQNRRLEEVAAAFHDLGMSAEAAQVRRALEHAQHAERLVETVARRLPGWSG